MAPGKGNKVPSLSVLSVNVAGADSGSAWSSHSPLSMFLMDPQFFSRLKCQKISMGTAATQRLWVGNR